MSVAHVLSLRSVPSPWFYEIVSLCRAHCLLFVSDSGGLGPQVPPMPGPIFISNSSLLCSPFLPEIRSLKLALFSSSPCLSLLSAGITGILPQARLGSTSSLFSSSPRCSFTSLLWSANPGSLFSAMLSVPCFDELSCPWTQLL